ncbi:MAG: Fur family transcriptional regulator [Candidatus Nanopelagicales bacterium]|jgi:Fur family ferric uptake transcriptional regulator
MPDWEERLRSQGYRVTQQRADVLQAVIDLGHGTPEEILARVQVDSPRVNLSTIYRTLEVLEQVGLVTHAHLGHGSPTYHSVDDDLHIHLVCRSCGAIESAPAIIAEPFCAALEHDHGFSTDLGHMAIHGLCHACREDAAAARG